MITTYLDAKPKESFHLTFNFALINLSLTNILLIYFTNAYTVYMCFIISLSVKC